MAAIVTITFSPAIDKSTTVVKLIPEKKLTCSNPVYEPGGGGINVARAIHKLGGNATAIYFAGGYTGKTFSKLLANELVESIIIETKENTRENLMVLETASNQQFRFGMPSTKLYKQEWLTCLSIIKGLKNVKYIVSSGGLSPNLPDDIFVRLSKIARKKNARLIIDTSGEALKKAIKAGVYLIKPNLKELSSLVGKEEIKVTEVEEVAKEVINNSKCEVVVVSLGASGALLITKNETIRVMPPKVKINSTVGAGDSMLAGIVLSLANHKNLTEVMQYGVACGTAATMNLGTQLCKKKDVLSLFKMIQLK
ncbi:1-phosphofructokinase family hexose kinase [Pedobacter cryophilus]|uniref:1-phosphofructokinase family hexose kinase n=2 Tax=Pedobacter cryophilus TaxID=2571271 RepID=A0A4U1BYW1_9SPHI|nr:1-phosphofructokinase family hexose kinase [Pedobacter cryophilus]